MGKQPGVVLPVSPPPNYAVRHQTILKFKRKVKA
jgi:hypothetical protein